jgi:hypothetical protein
MALPLMAIATFVPMAGGGGGGGGGRYGTPQALTCSEKGVRLAQKMQVGPCFIVGVQL